MEKDQIMYEDMQTAIEIIQSGELRDVAHKASEQHQLPLKTEFSDLFDDL